LFQHRVRAGRNWIMLAAFALCARAFAQTPARIDFQREIRPILSDNCFLCHGPDSDSRMAGLRLDRPEAALAARPHGAPVVPGNSAASLLYQRISNPDPNIRMPPAASRRSLTPAQIALLKRWIDQGAPWKEQWSFQPPVKAKPPSVKDAVWVRSPIDRFILARLEEKGLAPAPPADARTLIRRVALSVTGLPPKPSEVEAFLADAAPGAYERMVDRYLASPHYGEQRAHYWLDAVRYADTNGIHFDNYREIWPYRDWVIAAFNRNQPFNQFAIEQIAGDLLPNATLDQRIATGFQRSNVTTNEAGIIEDEYTEIYAKDRADTFGSVFLGLTVGCATCHDHKFDPISQKDYYSLGAFFRNTPQKVMDGNTSDQPPFAIVPRQEDRARWDQIAARQAAIVQEMSHARATAASPFETWLRSREPGSPAALFDEKDALFTADLAHLAAPGGDLKLGADGRPALYFASTGGASVAAPPKLDAEKPFSVAVTFFSPKGDGYNLAAHQNPKDKNRGWVLDVSGRLASFRLIGDSGDNIEIRAAMDRIEPSTWNSIVAAYDGSRTQSGLDLYLNGRALVTQGRNNPNTKLSGAIGVDDPLILGKSLVDGAVADFRIIGRVATEAEARLLTDGLVPESAPASVVNNNQTLFPYFLLREFEPYRTLAAEQNKLNLEAKEIVRHAATTPVMVERTDQKPFAHILYRGAYDQPRERVEASTPTVLPPMAAALPRNRLGLAKWLFTEDQPLTARVAVNRMWQEIFGVGLVRTADDFGSQGEPPSNPQLLDWLAVDFEQNGWDIKRFYRQILTSAAYRQLALATPQKLAQDPENRLLSRGLRFRMDAEMLRDYALAASGLLAPQIGGPSVKPYQPDGIWESIAMLGSNTRFYKQDSGNGLYRRSIYTLWKRAAPPAAMDILNAPTREGCTVRRERTDTPLQALVTMNDVQFVEAARTLAGAAIENGVTFAERLSYLSSRILIRPLTPDEQRIARKAYDDFERYYGAHPEDARKFLDDGERKGDPGLPAATNAALTMLASQLLNLDEVLNQ
jgi:hypothetical protein